MTENEDLRRGATEVERRMLEGLERIEAQYQERERALLEREDLLATRLNEWAASLESLWKAVLALQEEFESLLTASPKDAKPSDGPSSLKRLWDVVNELGKAQKLLGSGLESLSTAYNEHLALHGTSSTKPRGK